MADERGEPQFVVSSVGNLNDRTWATRSMAAEDLTPQFSFLLSRTVYVGDPNSSEQTQSDRYDRPLSLPSIGARDALRPTAREIVGHEPDLAAYYRQVMTLKGARPGPGDVDYWLRLEFVSAAVGREISFPWWDRVSDATPFLSWLRKTDPKDEFFDADQEWISRAAYRGDRLHIQDGDFEEEFANLSVDRAAFLGRLDAAETDIRRVITGLKNELGIDPWS